MDKKLISACGRDHIIAQIRTYTQVGVRISYMHYGFKVYLNRLFPFEMNRPYGLIGCRGKGAN